MSATDQLKSRFASIASSAKQAQRLTVEDDNVLDLIDNIDAELRDAMAIVNAARGVDEAGGSTYAVTVLFTVGGESDDLKSAQAVSDEVQSWLESLKAAIVDIHVRARSAKS